MGERIKAGEAKYKEFENIDSGYWERVGCESFPSGCGYSGLIFERLPGNRRSYVCKLGNEEKYIWCGAESFKPKSAVLQKGLLKG